MDIVSALGRLELFKGAVQVMLKDGILSNDEKRLIITLAGLLGLEGDEPLKAYQSIVEGTGLEQGKDIIDQDPKHVYESLIRAAYFDSDLSKDEVAVVGYLYRALNITQTTHEEIFANLKDKIEEEEKKNYSGKFWPKITLSEFSRRITSPIFDVVRRRGK